AGHPHTGHLIDSITSEAGVRAGALSISLPENWITIRSASESISLSARIDANCASTRKRLVVFREWLLAPFLYETKIRYAITLMICVRKPKLNHITT
ncbi:hypothetical protein, partial [Salmonella enterica]|uniref:hypothetical protein n=1 Tax=Salmonella enterica TaxID=28901 RepID=UPI001C53DFD5